MQQSTNFWQCCGAGHTAMQAHLPQWRAVQMLMCPALPLQEGHSRAVYTVNFHPDGSLAASGGIDSIGALCHSMHTHCRQEGTCSLCLCSITRCSWHSMCNLNGNVNNIQAGCGTCAPAAAS